MNFQCKNCNANMIFDPGRHKMLCPYCDSLDSEVRAGDKSMTNCPSCGGELTAFQFQSTTQCPFCGNYIIFDDMVSGEYQPDTIIPFAVSKEKAISLLEKELEDYLFAPASLLSKKRTEDMQGRYVPYFLYDLGIELNYEGNATKTRTWREGNYTYTEVCEYHLMRKLAADYENLPAESSDMMNDNMTDSLEPFDFKAERAENQEYTGLLPFDPKYMSGFYGEVYNHPSEEMYEKAKQRGADSINGRLAASMADFRRTGNPKKDEIRIEKKKDSYALLPIWHYRYIYNGVYDIYVNGQNGQLAGNIPRSKKKIFIYGLLCAGMWVLILDIIFAIIGNWLSTI